MSEEPEYVCIADDPEVCRKLNLNYFGEKHIGKDCPDYEEGKCKCRGKCMFKLRRENI
jgi:hypothetical protein